MIIAISGISSGIGQHCWWSLGLNLREIKMIGFSRSTPETEGPEAITLRGDVRDETGWDQCFERAHRAWGEYPDVVVNNAGINRLDWIKDIKLPELRDIYETNVIGYVRALQLIDSHHKHPVREQVTSPARVVNVGSIAGHTPMRASLSYCTAKAAVDMITLQASRELAPRVLVFGIAPGRLTDTLMGDQVDADVARVRGWDPAAMAQHQLQYIPLGRLGTPGEVAQVIKFLVFDAPEAMTGAIIDITGAQ